MEAHKFIKYFEYFLNTIDMENNYKDYDWVRPSFEDPDFSNKLCTVNTLKIILEPKELYEIKWIDEEGGKINFIKHKKLVFINGEGTTPFLILDVNQKGMFFNLNVTEVTPTHLNEDVFVFEGLKFDKLIQIIDML